MGPAALTEPDQVCTVSGLQFSDVESQVFQ